MRLTTYNLQLTTKKNMKNSEIHELTTEEVIARINEEKANLTKMKFAHTVSAIENPTRITKVRKDVARLNTELTKRKAEAKASAATESASE